MKRGFLPFLLLVFILGFHLLSVAQFKPEEIAERAKWEEFLKTAKIVNQDQPLSEREAVTEPWRLTLEKDGITKHGWWKDVEGRRKGYLEGWKWEIAAYRLDKLLELNMVPPTVEKRFRGDRGSCQLEVEYKLMYRDKVENDIAVPSHKIRDYNRTTYLQKVWDNLVANEDRNMGDILYTENWRMILIDHSRAFRTSRKYTKKLIHVKKGKKDREPIKELPSVFVKKLKGLTFELIKNAVGEYLTEKEINAVLVRRDLILKEINRLINDYGKNKVLY